MSRSGILGAKLRTRITCGLYVSIILGDYVRTILNLNTTNSTWNLEPRENFDILDMGGFPRGVGNQVSVEFNLIYRWHTSISNKDEKWTNEFVKSIFPDKDLNTLSMPDFLQGLDAWEKSLNPDPSQRTFGGMKRKENGQFEDSELIEMLTEATEDVAGTVSYIYAHICILYQRGT
jgi:hypothetical protein